MNRKKWDKELEEVFEFNGLGWMYHDAGGFDDSFKEGLTPQEAFEVEISHVDKEL